MNEEAERQELAVALARMEEYGGSFAANLARAWVHADDENDQRLRSAFGDLVSRYMNPDERVSQ